MSNYRSRSASWIISFLAATSLGSHQLSAQDISTTPPATPAQEQPEVLSRGPVHEAFAEPVTLQTQAGLIVPQQPPANIQEVPPAEKPQGSQYVWIPGYWSWDADRSGYIWVSACWRAAPPNMSWVPGYWMQVSGGWEWVAGYWAAANTREIVYLPAPPTVEDLEPVTLQPSPDMIWVPPCMYWSEGRYIRRAGYWLTAQPNWVWVPSHYIMTPRGYIFAEGHWDYALERRGVLFAPVYFPPAVYGRVGFTFSPSIVIDVGLLQVSLFAYPRYCHYYFGDYYDSVYLNIGIFPWFECRRYHTWYDPIYEHDRWRHHAEPRWEEHERNEYRRRCDDRNLRPAHTFREQESRLSRLPEPQRQASQLVQPIASVASRKTPMKYERIDADARQKISQQSTAVHTYSDNRNRWESPAATSRTTQPTAEHRTTTGTQPIERKQTVRPVEERKTAVSPTTQTVQPDQQLRPVERRQTVQPAEEHKTDAGPTIEHRQTVQSQRGNTVSPDLQRDRTFTPARETQVSRPERIQVPASPVIGNSGRQSIFQRGPPTYPFDESTDHDWDKRRK